MVACPTDVVPIIRGVSRAKQRAALKNDVYGWRFVNNSPDVRPAIRLRLELARDRAAGHTFDQVFADEIHWATEGIGLSYNDRLQWAVAFRATEPSWRAAYERTVPVVSLLGPELLAA
jgi:hypothetical protein